MSKAADTTDRDSSVRLGSSFRDPCGFIFKKGGVIYRQVNACYQAELELLHSSGLYEELTRDSLLLPHVNAPLSLALDGDAISVLRPKHIDFIAYPYEWCFTQLKDAALLTLDIQTRALAKGMTLKDASAYNVQFVEGSPIFIDTLSFARFQEGAPWIAYRQFCSHFLAPLALMSMVDARLSLLLRDHIDGIPLEIASRMLPRSSRFNIGLALHIHGQARAVEPSRARTPQKSNPPRVSRNGLMGLLASLRGTIEKLKYEPKGTVWADYYEETNYSSKARTSKENAVTTLIQSIRPKPDTCWDLGANTGQFSRFATAEGLRTLAWDLDPAAVERCYLGLKEAPDPLLLPLVQDLSNPSPSLGWAHRERLSLLERGPADLVMALALVHHLAIGNNLPFEDIASYFSLLCEWLLVEFVPKADSQVQRLLRSREDVFPTYTARDFEQSFGQWFECVQSVQLDDSLRTLYLFKRLSH